MGQLWLQSGFRSSNTAPREIYHSRVQGDIKSPDEDRTIMAEADMAQASHPPNMAQKSTYSASDGNIGWSPNADSKAKSWPERDHSNLHNDKRKPQEVILGMEAAYLESDGRYYVTHNEALNQTSQAPPTHAATPDGHGPSRKQQDRQEDSAYYRETKLKGLRWRVLKLRATVAEKRRELAHARLDVIRADEDFMKLVREMRMQPSGAIYDNSTLFERRYSKLQASRDKYGLLEDPYGMLEERLNREEYDLSQLEQELDTDEDEYLERQADESGSSSRATDDYESNGLIFAHDGQHDVYDEYLSRLGDADLVHEDLLELRNARRKLQGFQESKKRVGLELSFEDQETLDNYAAEKATLRGQLKEIKADVECLRIQCVESGLMEDGEEDGIFSISDSSVASQYERYPLLQEESDEKQVDQSSKSLLLDFDKENPGDRVERWLLHKLRSSSSEVELLARLSADDGVDTKVNRYGWQEQVLVFWFIDSTNLPPSAYQVPPSVYQIQDDALPKSPFTDRHNLALFNSGQAYLVELVIQSSSYFVKAELARMLQLVVPKVGMAKSVR